jgi:hypothetical protein
VVDLGQVRLRSNPRFRLIPYDRLSSTQQIEFRSLKKDRDFFGILVPPPESGLPAKSVSRDAALLFLALAESACLPNLLTDLLGNHANERLRQLVLDQVFEVEQAGRFLSGPAAAALLGVEPGLDAASRLARLSSEAIDYALALESLTVGELAARLYFFNAAPSTPALQRRFATTEQQCSFLYEVRGTEHRLRSKWRGEAIEDSWLMWSTSAVAEAAYKLYVSPLLEDLPRVFAVAVHAFAQVDCRRFKLGAGAYGLLRPDKLVAYFSSLDSLQRAAELIAGGATEAKAQGVPFSAPIDPAGLLSWGMDPPRFELAPQSDAVLSWRQWLSERIAVYVTAARQSADDVQAFVRQRIALDGVDPANWTPDLAIWRGPLGTEQGVG